MPFEQRIGGTEFLEYLFVCHLKAAPPAPSAAIVAPSRRFNWREALATAA